MLFSQDIPIHPQSSFCTHFRGTKHKATKHTRAFLFLLRMFYLFIYFRFRFSHLFPAFIFTSSVRVRDKERGVARRPTNVKASWKPQRTANYGMKREVCGSAVRSLLGWIGWRSGGRVSERRSSGAEQRGRVTGWPPSRSVCLTS
jgi:hypothetical protein